MCSQTFRLLIEVAIDDPHQLLHWGLKNGYYLTDHSFHIHQVVFFCKELFSLPATPLSPFHFGMSL